MLLALGGDQAAYRDLLSALDPFLRAFSGAGWEPPSLMPRTSYRNLVGRASEAPDLRHSPALQSLGVGIARYKLLDHFRRVGARRTVPLDDVGELFAEENVEEGAVQRDVSRLLAMLQPRQRALFQDVKLTGLSVREAADRGGMSETAAKVSLHRGMKALGKKVRDEDR